MQSTDMWGRGGSVLSRGVSCNTIRAARCVHNRYDGNAIFTGSATLDEHNNPVITYPGMCGCPQAKHGQPKPPCNPAAAVACRSGATYNQAIPSNRSDPLLKNWTKPLTNPILNNTG